MSERSVDTAAGEEPETLQSRLEEGDDEGPAAADVAPAAAADRTIADPAALLAYLDVAGHFHRDSRAGRVFHPGMVSLREDVPKESLHVSVDGNRLMAHVDEVSPLAADSEGPSRYSVSRAVAHNLVGMAQDLVSLLRGREGDHRCELNCEWVEGEADSTPDEACLLDPRTSAWTVQLEARVAGSLDEVRLRAALGTAAGRRAVPRDCLEVVECEDDDALHAARVRLHGTRVPITRFPPLHAYLARHPAGDLLMLNVNHAAADGFGALRVLERIAQAYAGDTDPDSPLDFVASRELPVRPALPPESIPVRLAKRAMTWVRDMLARPTGLAADGHGDDPACGFHLVALSAQQTRDVIDVERTSPDRDVLLAALHLAIGDWNRRHEVPGRRIGVLVPADLRPADLPPDIVGNFSVNARLSTSRHNRGGPASVLKAVTAQGKRTKRTRTGIALIAGLQRAGLLALWAKQSSVVLHPVTNNHMVDTAMICNLGSLEEAPRFGPDAGDTLELWFSAPVRSPMSLSIGAVTIGGRLHLSFRYPHRLFGPDAARRFAECYVAHVRRVADSAP
jgi:hypothetical protein